MVLLADVARPALSSLVTMPNVTVARSGVRSTVPWPLTVSVAGSPPGAGAAAAGASVPSSTMAAAASVMLLISGKRKRQAGCPPFQRKSSWEGFGGTSGDATQRPLTRGQKEGTRD